MNITDELVDRFFCNWLRDSLECANGSFALHQDDMAYNARLREAGKVILEHFGEGLDKGDNRGSITLD